MVKSCLLITLIKCLKGFFYQKLFFIDKFYQKYGKILVTVRPMFQGGEWGGDTLPIFGKVAHTDSHTLSIQGLDSHNSKDNWRSELLNFFGPIQTQSQYIFPSRLEVKCLVAFSFVECFSLAKLEE